MDHINVENVERYLIKKKLGREAVAKIFHEKHEDYQLVDRGSWKLQGNYEYCNRIFQDQDGDHWKVMADRIARNADWDYQYNSKIIQVEQDVITIIIWVPISEDEYDEVYI